MKISVTQMLQVTNFRHLRCSPNSLALRPHFNRRVILLHSLISGPRASSFPIVFCSSSSRHRSYNIIRRGNCSFEESDNKDRDSKELVMDSNESVRFNKRKAEGRDKSNKNLQLKSRKPNPVNTLCYVQILGTGMDTQDTSPSILLFFDKQRFIFNAGEGLQRFCTEHKIKLSKFDHIFLSRVCSETAGGLPGLLLTLSGIGEIGMSVKIWGPSDLNLLINAMSSFIPMAAMVHTNSFGSFVDHDGVVLHDDEVVKISAILIKPLNASHSKTTLPSNSKTEPVKPSDISVIYVCELPEIKGKFDPEKAKALGLKPGPKFRELQLGFSVKSDYQDITVHSSDVLGPSIPGPIVLLVDCPTEYHMRELLSIQSLNNYYPDYSENVIDSHKNVHCVIHLTPMCIASTPDYAKWMKRFGGAQHIMAGHKIENAEIPILKSSFRVSTRLNYLCPQFFPSSGLCSLQPMDCLMPGHILPKEETISEVCRISCDNLLKFHLRPYSHLGLDRSAIPDLVTSSEILDELLSENPEITEAVHQVGQFWTNSKEGSSIISSHNYGDMIEDTVPKCLESISRKHIEIVFLGTGSSQPSKYRNVTSIFINLFSKGSLLFDCGEGTLSQLRRRYGIEGADNAVRALKVIWISHIHADHHTGLARILALRSNLLKEEHEPLLVIGPAPLKRYLDAYQKLEDLDMQFLDCRQTTKASLAAFEQSQVCERSPDSSENVEESSLFSEERNHMKSFWKNPIRAAVFPMLEKMKKILDDVGLESLISFPVVHCPQAFGVVLKASERMNCDGKLIPGWKLAYSGDTRPCPELIEASHGATLLIHEATFEEGMEEEAIQKNHSTAKEAIEAGTSAGAYRIILTHFSQRYPKIPVLDNKRMHNACIAFDLMSINFADLPVLPKLLPFLKLLFKNEVEADELDDDDASGAPHSEAAL